MSTQRVHIEGEGTHNGDIFNKCIISNAKQKMINRNR